MTLFPDRDISTATLADLERIEDRLGRSKAEEFLNNEFDDYLRRFFREHGIDIIDDIKVSYDPEGNFLEDDAAGTGFPLGHGVEAGEVYIGTEPENYPVDFDYFLTPIAGEEYLHCHYPHTVDAEALGWSQFDSDAQNVVDVIGNVLNLYCEGAIGERRQEEYLNSLETDYSSTVRNVTEELLEDFENTQDQKEMMSIVLGNPEPVFNTYREHLDDK